MKREQIEEKAKELYPDEHACKDEFTRQMRQSFIELFRKCFFEGANFILSHQWVSVEDELPKEGELAIVTFIDYKGKRRYAAGERTGDGMQVYGILSPSPMPPVTHWMPIPPMEEEGGEK